MQEANYADSSFTMGLTSFDILFISGLVLAGITIFLLLYWSVIISTRLRLNIKQYKAYIKSHYFDKHVHSKLKFAYETVRNRNIFLLILIAIEIVLLFAATLPLPILNFELYLSEFVKKKIKETFRNCTVSHVLAISYIYPISAFAIVSVGMLVITHFLFISFFNSYLACRYLGYSFPRRNAIKYVLLWIFLYIFLTVCTIPYLQILFPLAVLVVFINWMNLVYTTRQLCKAIRSIIREIELFEWNPESYRMYSRDLKHYKITMGVVILASFFLVMAIFVFASSAFLQILLDSCYLQAVFGLNTTQYIPRGLNPVYTFLQRYDTYIAYTFAVFDAIFMLIPSLLLFLCHFVNKIYHIGTGRAYFNRMNRTLFDPLLHQ